MDTVEGFGNGRYFLDGMMNLTEGERWHTYDSCQWEAGCKKTTPDTSPLSVAMRSMIRFRLRSQWRSPTWRTMIRGGWAKTNSLGGLIGRWLPWPGVAIAANDVAMITWRSIRRYNLVVKPEHEV